MRWLKFIEVKHKVGKVEVSAQCTITAKSPTTVIVGILERQIGRFIANKCVFLLSYFLFIPARYHFQPIICFITPSATFPQCSKIIHQMFYTSWYFLCFFYTFHNAKVISGYFLYCKNDTRLISIHWIFLWILYLYSAKVIRVRV